MRNSYRVLHKHERYPWVSKFRFPLRTLLIFLSASLFITAPCVHAEDGTLTAQDVGQMSIEELAQVSIVSLTPESPLTTDVNTSVFLPEEWNKSGARRTYEVFQYEPGIMNSSTLNGAPSTNIRGYTSNFSGARGISTTLDDVPLNAGQFGTAAYGVPNWGLGTLDRVELMKGPSSSLYGGDAMYGAITMRTFNSESDSLSVTSSGATGDYENGSFRMSKGLGGPARIVASGDLRHQGPENLQYPKAGSEIGRYSDSYLSQTGVVKLIADPTDRLHLELGGYGSGWKSDDFPGLGTTLTGDQSLFESGSDSIDSSSAFFMTRGLASYRITDSLAVEAMPYYWRQSGKSFLPYPGTGSPPEFDANFSANITEDRFGTRILFRQPVEGQSDLQWVAGYMVENLSVSSLDDSIEFPGDASAAPHNVEIDDNISGEDRTQQAGFFQVRYNPYAPLYLRAGGRYDSYSDADGKYTPRYGASYLVNESTALKLSYGEAFRPPAFAELRGVLGTAGKSDLESETMKNFEFGMLHLAGSTTISTSVYYSELDNGIGFAPVSNIPGFTSQYQNFQSARSLGGELKARTEIEDRYLLGVGYGYANSTTLSNESKCFSAYPRHSIFTETGVKFPSVDMEVSLWNRIYAVMDETTFDSASSPDNLRPYWRVDLGLSKQVTPSWTVRGVVRNLFDRDLAVPSIWGSPGGVPEPGISGLISIEFRAAQQEKTSLEDQNRERLQQ